MLTVEPYDIEALKKAFADADANGWFIEAMFLEPVMGEGDPGRGVPPAFYAAARELTKAHGALLLVDSIQAGLRANGVLSIVDYPGFENAEAPDMETYSKALNAGQYPLSVLAVSERAGETLQEGPVRQHHDHQPARARRRRARCWPSSRRRCAPTSAPRARKRLDKLEKLKAELGGLITKVQGTGLLFSCELSPQFKCYGAGSTEEWLREHGIGVIHGGANSLRFTPTFNITSEEIDLMVGMVARALQGRAARAAGRGGVSPRA